MVPGYSHFRQQKGERVYMAIFHANDIIEMALELEKSGEVFYSTVAGKVTTPEVRALFEDLADQERYHYVAFEKLSGTVWDAGASPADDWDQYLMYLQATIQSAFFEGADKALAVAEQVSDEKEALQMALDFEKETMLFFYDLRDKVSGADKDVVEGIIAEEKNHVRRLAGML
jgi:rubrerythrin